MSDLIHVDAIFAYTAKPNLKLLKIKPLSKVSSHKSGTVFKICKSGHWKYIKNPHVHLKSIIKLTLFKGTVIWPFETTYLCTHWDPYLVFAAIIFVWQPLGYNFANADKRNEMFYTVRDFQMFQPIMTS